MLLVGEQERACSGDEGRGTKGNQRIEEQIRRHYLVMMFSLFRTIGGYEYMQWAISEILCGAGMNGKICVMFLADGGREAKNQESWCG